jgi:hypothetical protein
MVKLNVGDFVVANRKPPVMKIIDIKDKKAMCEWTVRNKKPQKLFFLTELRKYTQDNLVPKTIKVA